MRTSRLILIPLCAALFGCSDDGDDLQAYIAEVKGRTSRAIEPLPQIKQYDAFTYAPGERRDPFETSLITSEQRANSEGSGIRPDFNRNKEPLEEFPMDSLRMVGTIQLQSRMYALIKAPDKVIHRIALGDHMGQNYGKVTKVSEAEIEMIEIIPDGFGGWMQRPASLALAE